MDRRTLLLDLDGTLWDSRPWYAEILAELGGGPAKDLEQALASGANVVRLAQEAGVSRSRLATGAKRSAKPIVLFDGVHETLLALKERGTQIGIVTNLPGWLADPLIDRAGINDFFCVVVTRSNRVPPKPKPGGIYKALEALGAESKLDAWYVGDANADAGAAAAAGVPFAWAAYGYESVTAGTERVLHGFVEVLDL